MERKGGEEKAALPAPILDDSTHREKGLKGREKKRRDNAETKRKGNEERKILECAKIAL